MFNFSAGPAVLPKTVLAHAQAELLDWRGTGMSVMEMSHRGPEFEAILAEAEADLRTLIGVPSNYKILFLQGGGFGQFASVPLNLLGQGGAANYVISGGWSKAAAEEARRYGAVHIAASSEASASPSLWGGGARGEGVTVPSRGSAATSNATTLSPTLPPRGREQSASPFTWIPAAQNWQFSSNISYIYACSNETVFGNEMHTVPTNLPAPLVCDASSHFLSRPVDVSQFGVLYAGAQKNVGPAGVTIVIVREDLLDRALPICPSFMHYKTMAANNSMLNTPPCFSIYMVGLVLKDLIASGGLPAAQFRNIEKSKMLYDCIDASSIFSCPVVKPDRSRMNVVFRSNNAETDAKFLKFAEVRGLKQLKGHRSVGGIRASLYNAMPLAGVAALVDAIKEFERNG
jgi:phosphoserine aminotransferase